MAVKNQNSNALWIVAGLVAGGAMLSGFLKPVITAGSLYVPTYNPGYLSRYYSAADVAKSNTAQSLGIDNTPDADTLQNASYLAQMVLDPITDYFNGAKLSFNSWYRSPALNSHPSIGGSPTSDHLDALASDVESPTGDNTDIVRAVIDWNIPFDQLIIYDSLTNPSRIHLSYDPDKMPSDQKRQIQLKQNGQYSTLSYSDIIQQYA